jgi:hypothetical protein
MTKREMAELLVAIYPNTTIAYWLRYPAETVRLNLDLATGARTLPTQSALS